MKKIISAVILSAAILVVAPQTFAATTKKKTVVKTTTTTTTTSTNPAVETYVSSSKRGPQLSADVGLGTIDSRFAFGAGFHAETPTEIEHNWFKFGGQTGFYYGSSNNVSTWSIPILATGTYQFSANTSFKPYLGLGMGISIDHASATNVSTTNVHFALLFKPGINFNRNMYVEVPIGTLASGFALLPSFGLRF